MLPERSEPPSSFGCFQFKVTVDLVTSVASKGPWQGAGLSTIVILTGILSSPSLFFNLTS